MKKKTKKKTSRGLDPSSLSSRAFSSAKSPTVCASPNTREPQLPVVDTAPGALFPPRLSRTIRTSERIQSSVRREDVKKVTPRKDFAWASKRQTKNSSILKRDGRPRRGSPLPSQSRDQKRSFLSSSLKQRGT